MILAASVSCKTQSSASPCCVPCAVWSRYTSKTDVWSFAVLLHEVFANGAKPYASMTNAVVVARVGQGYRLPQLPSCPSELYHMMQLCWDIDPERRPDFGALLSSLSGLLDRETKLAGSGRLSEPRLSLVWPQNATSAPPIASAASKPPVGEVQTTADGYLEPSSLTCFAASVPLTADGYVDPTHRGSHSTEPLAADSHAVHLAGAGGHRSDVLEKPGRPPCTVGEARPAVVNEYVYTDAPFEDAPFLEMSRMESIPVPIGQTAIAESNIDHDVSIDFSCEAYALATQEARPDESQNEKNGEFDV